MLDIIGQKLKEMRDLAEYASVTELSDAERTTINTQLKALQEEVNVLDEKSRTFWLDNQ